MGLFTRAGRAAERFKQTVESAAAERAAAVCDDCGKRFYGAREACDVCGGPVVPREDA